MLDKITITKSEKNEDGSFSVSVQTNDTVAGSHRFAMTINADSYSKLPNTNAAKETGIKALVKASIQKQHADWLQRIETEKKVPFIMSDPKISI